MGRQKPREIDHLQTLTIQYGLFLLFTSTGRSLVTGGTKGRETSIASALGWKRVYNTAIYKKVPLSLPLFLPSSLSSLPSFPPFTASSHVRKDIILYLEQVVHHGLEGQLVQDGRDGIKPTARRETSQIHILSPLFLWQQVLWSLFHNSCVPIPLVTQSCSYKLSCLQRKQTSQIRWENKTLGHEIYGLQ